MNFMNSSSETMAVSSFASIFLFASIKNGSGFNAVVVEYSPVILLTASRRRIAP